MINDERGDDVRPFILHHSAFIIFPRSLSMHFDDWIFPGWGVVVIAAGLVAVAWARAHWAGPSPHGLTPSSPNRLFRGLCRAHGLAWADRRLLLRLARFQELDNPGRLFLEPERFDPAALDPGLPDAQSRYQASASGCLPGSKGRRTQLSGIRRVGQARGS